MTTLFFFLCCYWTLLFYQTAYCVTTYVSTCLLLAILHIVLLTPLSLPLAIGSFVEHQALDIITWENDCILKYHHSTAHLVFSLEGLFLCLKFCTLDVAVAAVLRLSLQAGNTAQDTTVHLPSLYQRGTPALCCTLRYSSFKPY